MSFDQQRRNALQLCAAIALIGMDVDAQAMNPKLDPESQAAKNLGYVERASAKTIDAKKYPTYQVGQTCANCQLIQMRYGPLRPCSLFPGNMVTATGWCSGWTQRTVNK